jgi:cation diffusion facilitator CzcD-associated flavoprotein CzcO
MEVCIIGGGFSGIASAKACKDYDFIPFVLSKDPEIGGLWRGGRDQIGIWDSLKANMSKYGMSFSDYPFRPEVEAVPPGAEILNYMKEYVEKHDLLKYFNFNSRVTEVSRNGQEYSVKWVQDEEVKEKNFKFVMVCTGHESKEYFPFENPAAFSGTIIKSGHYREPSVFTDKKVVVIGRSFSGSDIALEATLTASEVVQICRTPRSVDFVQSEAFLGTYTHSPHE